MGLDLGPLTLWQAERLHALLEHHNNSIKASSREQRKLLKTLETQKKGTKEYELTRHRIALHEATERTCALTISGILSGQIELSSLFSDWNLTKQP